MNAHAPTPKFWHITRELDGALSRESYVYSTPAGSVELWRTPSSGNFGSEFYGGVEIHSPEQLFDFAPEPFSLTCQYTATGKCWGDGSSLAFDQFEHSFNAPDFIRAELADWHASRFGEQS